jgi:hypothetical protein
LPTNVEGKVIVSSDSVAALDKKINTMLDEYAKAVIDELKEAHPIDEKLPSAEDARREIEHVMNLMRYPLGDPRQQKIEPLDVIVNGVRVGYDPRLGINLVRNRIALFREAVINDYLKSLKKAIPEAPSAPPLDLLVAGIKLTIPALT